MKIKAFAGCLASFSALSVSLAWGQATSAQVNLESPVTDDLNRFGVSFRMGFNISVDFKNLGGFPALGPMNGVSAAGNPGPATGGGINRTYDDGYNWVMSGGNPLGSRINGDPANITSYWGYDYGDNNATAAHPSQYNAAEGTITMHSTSSEANVSSNNRDDDPLLGFEITYNRELFRKESWRFGVEAAFGYTDLSVRDNRTLSANATRLSDTFEFPLDETSGNQVIAPSAPYSGTFLSGPYYLIDSPNLSPYTRRTETLVNAVSITGRRRFDADLYGFRLGPYAEVQLGDRVLANLSAGLALVQVDSKFGFDETVTVGGRSRTDDPQSNSDSHDDLQLGYYVSGNVLVKLNDAWNAFAGAQFQDAGKYSHKLAGKEAKLNLGEAVFVAIGVSYSF